MKELEILGDPSEQSYEKLTAQQTTYKKLRFAIMIGRIAPGVALTIRGLAESLNVSPTPVREAIRILCTEGALEVLDNRRLMTPQMDSNRFEELIVLRTLIECHAAERAMPYMSEILIDQLENIDQQIDMAIKENDLEKIVIYNQQFHSTLYKANSRQVILPMVESVWLQLGPYTRVALSQLTELYLIDHHKQAILALRNRDVKALTKAIADDVEDGIGQLGRLALLKEEAVAVNQKQ